MNTNLKKVLSTASGNKILIRAKSLYETEEECPECGSILVKPIHSEIPLIPDYVCPTCSNCFDLKEGALK